MLTETNPTPRNRASVSGLGIPIEVYARMLWVPREAEPNQAGICGTKTSGKHDVPKIIHRKEHPRRTTLHSKCRICAKLFNSQPLHESRLHDLCIIVNGFSFLVI